MQKEENGKEKNSAASLKEAKLPKAESPPDDRNVIFLDDNDGWNESLKTGDPSKMK